MVQNDAKWRQEVPHVVAMTTKFILESSLLPKFPKLPMSWLESDTHERFQNDIEFLTCMSVQQQLTTCICSFPEPVEFFCAAAGSSVS